MNSMWLKWLFQKLIADGISDGFFFRRAKAISYAI